MDTRYLASAVVLASLFCLAILVTALLWKKDRAGDAKRPNYRVFLIMGAVMAPVGLIETLVFWRQDMPLIVPLPLLVIGLLFLVIGLASMGRRKSG
jgi:amino acid transporter